MMFCYKLITENQAPNLSGGASPARRAVINVPSSLSQLIGTLDYEHDNVLDSIPEHDWRLLAALARKREDDDARERLADQFRKMWQTEKREREMVEAETMDQYNKYLHKKRQQERSCQEYRQLQKMVEQHVRRGELLDCIRHKERKSAYLLAFNDDKKASELVDKVIEEQARAQLAADRRSRLCAAHERKRLLDLADAQRRADDALRRRNALLRDASQRVAISNALSSWESTLLRQEVKALDSARRTAHAVRAALVDARSTRLAKAREHRQRRARKLAAVTSQMREAIRNRDL